MPRLAGRRTVLSSNLATSFVDGWIVALLFKRLWFERCPVSTSVVPACLKTAVEPPEPVEDPSRQARTLTERNHHSATLLSIHSRLLNKSRAVSGALSGRKPLLASRAPRSIEDRQDMHGGCPQIGHPFRLPKVAFHLC